MCPCCVRRCRNMYSDMCSVPYVCQKVQEHVQDAPCCVRRCRMPHVVSEAAGTYRNMQEHFCNLSEPSQNDLKHFSRLSNEDFGSQSLFNQVLTSFTSERVGCYCAKTISTFSPTFSTLQNLFNTRMVQVGAISA